MTDGAADEAADGVTDGTQSAADGGSRTKKSCKIAFSFVPSLRRFARNTAWPDGTARFLPETGCGAGGGSRGLAEVGSQRRKLRVRRRSRPDGRSLGPGGSWARWRKSGSWAEVVTRWRKPGTSGGNCEPGEMAEGCFCPNVIPKNRPARCTEPLTFDF